MTDLVWTPVQIRLGQIVAWTDNPRMSTRAQGTRHRDRAQICRGGIGAHGDRVP